MTMKWVFDLHERDTYWCTADIGWVTGHSYIVYGPLSAGATSVMYEGAPDYPQPDRFWRLAEKYRVNIFYTSPTAIRSFVRQGDQWSNAHDLSSLRLLGSPLPGVLANVVDLQGRPVEANREGFLIVRRLNPSIRPRGTGITTPSASGAAPWWRTETGSILISPMPGATVPGPACFARCGKTRSGTKRTTAAALREST